MCLEFALVSFASGGGGVGSNRNTTSEFARVAPQDEMKLDFRKRQNKA